MENTYYNFDIFYILQSWIYVSSKLIKFIIGCRRDAVTRKSRGLSTGATLRLSRLLKLTGFTWRRYERGWIGVVMFTGINRKVYSSHPGETNAGTLKSDRAIFHSVCLAARRSRYRFSIYREEWRAEHDRAPRRPIAGILHACSHFRNLKEKTYYRVANVGCSRVA